MFLNYSREHPYTKNNLRLEWSDMRKHPHVTKEPEKLGKLEDILFYKNYLEHAVQ